MPYLIFWGALACRLALFYRPRLKVMKTLFIGVNCRLMRESAPAGRAQLAADRHVGAP